YAKLATGIARTALVRQGFAYLRNALATDPLTPLAMVAAPVLAARAAPGARRTWLVALAAGLPLQILYLVWVGGDFMAGRFLSPAAGSRRRGVQRRLLRLLRRTVEVRDRRLRPDGPVARAPAGAPRLPHRPLRAEGAGGLCGGGPVGRRRAPARSAAARALPAAPGDHARRGLLAAAAADRSLVDAAPANRTHSCGRAAPSLTGANAGIL